MAENILATKGQGTRKLLKIHALGSKSKPKRLPVGDVIWIARNKVLHNEYVLDFIVERKNVNDLCSSIRDNRYKDYDLDLRSRYILWKVTRILVELQTVSKLQILEGFDVQRTTSLPDTIKKYCHLT